MYGMSAADSLSENNYFALMSDKIEHKLAVKFAT